MPQTLGVIGEGRMKKLMVSVALAAWFGMAAAQSFPVIIETVAGRVE